MLLSTADLPFGFYVVCGDFKLSRRMFICLLSNLLSEGSGASFRFLLNEIVSCSRREARDATDDLLFRLLSILFYLMLLKSID